MARAKSYGAPVKRILSGIDIYDLAGTAGFGLLLYGLWLVYRPAAPIAAGVILLAIAVLPSLRRRTP